MNEVAVDIEQASAVLGRMDQVAFPDFVEQGLGLGHDGDHFLGLVGERRGYRPAAGAALGGRSWRFSAMRAALPVRPRK